MSKKKQRFTFENTSDPRYIFENEDTSAHWAACEKYKKPYILLTQVGKKYCEIHFDVTNRNVKLNEISESIKRIYQAYIDFYMIPSVDIDYLFDQDDDWFFTLVVKLEHAESFAFSLFDYLSDKISIDRIV